MQKSLSLLVDDITVSFILLSSMQKSPLSRMTPEAVLVSQTKLFSSYLTHHHASCDAIRDWRYPKTSGLLIIGSLGYFCRGHCVEFVLSSFLISSVGQSSLFISLLPNIISPSFRFFGWNSLSIFETFPFSSCLDVFVRSFSVITSFLLQTHPFIASNDDGNVDMISMWVCRQLEERRSRVHSMDSPSSD